MNRQEAFAKLQSLSDAFVAQLAHPEGGRVTRALLRNVDAEFVDELFVVFKNKDNKVLVLPFTANLPSAAAMRIIENSGKKEFPDAKEVRVEYMERILPFLIKRDASIAEDAKDALIDFIADWSKSSPINPENLQKLKQFEELKKELTGLGLVQP